MYTMLCSQQRDSVSENKHTSSIPGASFNFINSIIGAGIIGGLCAWILCIHLSFLGIPSALREAGLIPGILLLVFVAVITGAPILFISYSYFLLLLFQITLSFYW